MATKRRNKAVFIDRDGTIARDVPYCSRPEDFELLPGVTEGIKLLKEHGFKVVVITNQSGVGRGYFSEHTLSLIHQKMMAELDKGGAAVDGIYYCPHHPDDDCACRKPRTKMLERAASELDIDISQSYMIGDSKLDMDLAQNAGCTGILLKPSEKGDILNVHSFKGAADSIIKLERANNLKFTNSPG